MLAALVLVCALAGGMPDGVSERLEKLELRVRVWHLWVEQVTEFGELLYLHGYVKDARPYFRCARWYTRRIGRLERRIDRIKQRYGPSPQQV